MKTLTRVKLKDLQFFYLYKPSTYNYFIEKLDERIHKGETVQLELTDSSTFQPINTLRFQEFLKTEVENSKKWHVWGNDWAA
jgi:hypothetical protein